MYFKIFQYTTKYSILFCCIFIVCLGCTSPKLMTYNKFSIIEDLDLPKIVQLKSNNKELLYFGTYHSNTMNDILFPTIERKFETFRPDFVLHEGNNWPIYKDRDSTIAVSGEPGFIMQLSHERGIEYATIEPTEKDEYAYVIKKHGLDWTVLMYLCRQIDNQQRLAASYGTIDVQFEQNMNYFLSKLAEDGIPIKDEQLTFQYWKNSYESHLKRKLIWQTFDPNLYYPNKYLTRLNYANRTSDEFRNLLMIEKIMNTLKNYDRVMVVVGGGHLIVQEKLLTHKFQRLRKKTR